MMRRVCSCGCATPGTCRQGCGGQACYGPNVTAAATWLASQDVIGVQRAADMMSTLLGAPVSTGFVSSCLARLDDALAAAWFDPHVFTVRTLCAYAGGGPDLVWYGAAGTRTKKAISTTWTPPHKTTPAVALAA